MKPGKPYLKGAIQTMATERFFIRNAKPSEYGAIGQLMVGVYSSLEGFPKPADQPAYYDMLKNVGQLTQQAGTEIIVAALKEDKAIGAVVYFKDMKHYGSGGAATREFNAAGFRLLAVDPACRGMGIGKALTLECLRRAKGHGRNHLVIHTTMAMQTAWKMYEAIGFLRAPDLDFTQRNLPVFGFRYRF